jgi:transcription antitermination factor NusG
MPTNPVAGIRPIVTAFPGTLDREACHLADHVVSPAADPPGWYALRVRNRCEAKVRDALRAANRPEFLPSYLEKSRWKDRVKALEKPLFPGYLFTRFSRFADASAILSITGVIQILGHDELSSISAAEIANLQLVCESPTVSLRAHVTGETVTVARGSLAGVRGVVIRAAGKTRIVVSIDLLRRSVEAEIDVNDLEKSK